MRRKLWISAFALTLSVAQTAAASTQDEWAQQVRRLLAQVSATAQSRGMRLTHEPYIGSLTDGNTSLHTVRLDGGHSYALIGVCDNDCSDLDMRLYDGDGDEVAADVENDDTPVVTVTPSRTSTYTVRAIMANCTSEPCRYGIGVYGR
jgi:hypothetical protein